MPPPPATRLRVVRYAPGWGYSAAEWERALAAIDFTRPHAAGGPLRLKIPRDATDPTDASVWHAPLTLGRRTHDLVLKVEPLDTPADHLKALLRRSKPFRQWRGALAADARGVRAAQPRALLRGRLGPRTLDVLVLEAIDAPTLLEIARDHAADTTRHPDPRGARALADALGRFTADLARRGLTNRDHKPSNVLVFPPTTDREPPAFALVDTVAVTAVRARHAAPAALPAMLTSLLLETLGTGNDPGPRLRLRVLRAAVGRGPARRDHRRRLARTLAAALAAHGDPTPSDDPLARG